MSRSQATGVDAAFFEELYDGHEGWISLWRPGETQWVELPNLPTNCPPDQYYGVATRRENMGLQRGGRDAILSVPAIWCDFDCASPSKKKRHPSREVAEHILGDLPIKPSTVVWSGGGFHLYWLLNEPALPDEAAGVIQSWQGWIASGPLRDYDLDSTFDLPRVLRVPGTLNTRYATPVVVSVVDRIGRRYSLDDFSEYVANSPVIVRPHHERYQVDELTLKANLNPTTERLETLLENSPEFQRVWRHKKDLPSASEYDLSLASHAVGAGWSDQEIAALLIAHRRKHYGDAEKIINRPDYVVRTIQVARGDSKYEQSLRALSGSLDELTAPGTSEDGGTPVVTRAAILDHVSTILGVPVARWIQFGEERATYYLELTSGKRILVGTAGDMIRGDGSIRAAIYEATRVHMPRTRGRAWTSILEGLAAIVEIEDQEEAGHVEMIRLRIEDYLARRDVHDHDGRVTAVRQKLPFISDGFIHLNEPDFEKWLDVSTRDRYSRGQILAALRLLGWERTKENHRGAPTTRYWRVALDDQLTAILESNQ